MARRRVSCLTTGEAAEGGTGMAQVTRLGRVLVPVADQDEAIAFYTHVLGFTLTADVPFGQGSRWVEVTPPGGGAAEWSPRSGTKKHGRRRTWSIETSRR